MLATVDITLIYTFPKFPRGPKAVKLLPVTDTPIPNPASNPGTQKAETQDSKENAQALPGHSSLATSLTRPSLANVFSSVIPSAPTATLAKPHWGLMPMLFMASSVENALALGDDGGGLADAGPDELRVLELGLLGGDDAEDDVLALGEVAEGLEAAGAGVVVLEEEGVVV